MATNSYFWQLLGLLTVLIAVAQGGYVTEHISDEPLSSECKGLECADKIWCRRLTNYKDITKIWSSVTFFVESVPSDSPAPCIITGSEDSNLSRQIFFRKNGTLFEAMKETNAETTSQATLRRLGLYPVCNYGKCEYKFSPYLLSCIKLCPGTGTSDMVLKISAKREDNKLVGCALVCLGLFLLFSSRTISESIQFYYATGTSLGVILSFSIATYFIMKRFLPRHTLMAAFGALVALATQALIGTREFMQDWMLETAQANQEYIFYYLFASTLLSFAVTHFFLKGESGSRVSSSVKDITRWMINLCGLLCISFSTASVGWSMVLTLLTMVGFFVLMPLGNVLYWIRGSDTPPLPKKYLATPYLTMEEYKMSGQIETDAAITSLVSSPAFKEWAVMNASRITVTPRKALDFSDDDE